MARLTYGWMIVGVLSAAACGGSDKPKPKQVVTEEKEAPPPKKETEEDRAAMRDAAAAAVVPADSTCLPPALKEEKARLELAAIGSDAVLCATDTDPDRLVGELGCWKIDLSSGELAFRSRDLIPGRGVMVKLHQGCAWGHCVPDAEGDTAHMVKSLDGGKVAVLAGDTVHIFEGDGKEPASKLSIRGDKGVTGDVARINWLGDAFVVEAADGVYVFKADGTAVGPVVPLGSKDNKPATGTVSLLDKTRIAIAQQGFSTVHTYDASSGARAKLVRKTPKTPCKPAEMETYFKGETDGVPAKCKAALDKGYGHLVGADAVAGSKNLLVLLRGPRLGELAVLDAKTLAEKKSIRLPWCEGDEGDGAAADKKTEKKAADKDDAADTGADDGGE